MKEKKRFEEGLDYYLDNGKVIMTEAYHMNRGYCCGSGCKFCVYSPLHVKGTTTLQEKFLKTENKNLNF